MACITFFPQNKMLKILSLTVIEEGSNEKKVIFRNQLKKLNFDKFFEDIIENELLKKMTAVTLVLMGRRRILSKQSYSNSCFRYAKPVVCQKQDPEVQHLQEVDVKITCLKLFAKIAVR